MVDIEHSINELRHFVNSESIFSIICKRRFGFEAELIKTFGLI
jgi:hypothetical protein